ncbi:hypothetical protein Tco_1036120, partial [Tanacetum coccineum]
SREVEFRMDLIPRAMLVAKSPYRLAPMEMQELSNQLKELQEKDYRELNKLTVKNRYTLPRIDDSARILEAQSEASRCAYTPAEMLKGLDKQFKRKEDGGLYLVE